jgi:hypothetical protein
LGKNEKEHVKWYGHILRVGGVAEGNIDWWTEGRKGTGRSEMKRGREVAIAMKQEYKHLKT